MTCAELKVETWLQISPFVDYIKSHTDNMFYLNKD